MAIGRFWIIGLIGLTTLAASAARGQGIWISPEDMAQRPRYGPAWDRVLRGADRTSYGEPNLADQDSGHDTKVLAAALAFAGTGDADYRNRAVAELLAVVGTENNVDPDCRHTSRPPEFGSGPPGARSTNWIACMRR